MASEHRASSSPTQPPLQRAVDFLISSEWLIGEAADEGLGPSGQEVERRLQARIRSYANGKQEFDQLLAVTGRTVEDAMFDIKLELASSRIRQLLASRQAKITEAQIANYYRENKQQFIQPERRQVQVVNSTNEVAAERIKREAAHGRNLTTQLNDESLVYTYKLYGNHESALETAIFSAKANTLIGPVAVGSNRFVFEVQQVRPAHQETLGQAHSSIARQLATEQAQRTLDMFINAFTKRWIARTRCLAGVALQACRQYVASQAIRPQAPPSLG